MEPVGFWEAWSLWLQAQPLTDKALWGVLPVVWLGRAAKVLQFLTGLSLIIQVIGLERVTKWVLENFWEHHDRLRRLHRSLWLNLCLFIGNVLLASSYFAVFVLGASFETMTTNFVTVGIIYIPVVAVFMRQVAINSFLYIFAFADKDPYLRYFIIALFLLSFILDLFAS